jgi:hypothetical protein
LVITVFGGVLRNTMLAMPGTETCIPIVALLIGPLMIGR